MLNLSRCRFASFVFKLCIFKLCVIWAGFDMCLGCLDEDNDDEHGPGDKGHRDHDEDCIRHRPSWTVLPENRHSRERLSQSHIDLCILCQRDVQRALQIKSILKWLTAACRSRRVALYIAEYNGQRCWF